MEGSFAYTFCLVWCIHRRTALRLQISLTQYFLNMSIHVATSIPWYPSEQFFIVCECFSHYFCWNRTLIGPKRLSHWRHFRDRKSANRSDLSIKTTKDNILYNYKCHTKEIFTTLVFILPFPYVLEGLWVLNRGSVLNGLPNDSHGYWPLNPMFVNYFWQECPIGVHDALGHLAGILCIKFREDYFDN
jgi:hypothetical protein